jgi:hypothetical protein
MPTEFPIGDTLAEGTCQVTECLLRGTSLHLYLGERPGHPEERYFVSTMWAPKAPVLQLRHQLAHEVPGVYDLVYIGHFDVRGDDESRHREQRDHCALVEKLPPGDGAWLPRFMTDPLGPRSAVALGLSAGRILEQAMKAGVLLPGVRPENMWARCEGELVVTAGLTGRNREFFAHVGGVCMIPAWLYERLYVAPEAFRDGGECEESLVFTLATMIAEWGSGKYPFPDSWAKGNTFSLYQGRHAPLEVPEPLARLLKLSLKPRPEYRPTLAHFLKRLSVLTPAELEK